jgi:hypothetical protein
MLMGQASSVTSTRMTAIPCHEGSELRLHRFQKMFTGAKMPNFGLLWDWFQW